MLIYAHRGASADFLEGTKAAYEGAIAQGADGFECDVRLTKDQQIICYHDANTTRLAEVNLEIANTDYAKLKQEVDPYLLTELLDLAIAHKKNLAIETKHPVPTGGLIEKMVHQLLASKEKQIRVSGINISIMSFSWLATQRNIRAGFESVYLIADERLAKLNLAGVIAPSIRVIKNNSSFVEKQKIMGRKVFVWTVNDPSDVKLCADAGVDVIMSDKPAQARKALGYS